MTPDRELLRQFAEERAEPALAELVRRHVDLVYSAALRQVGGDAHFAQDVVQHVFIDLARKAGALKDRATLEGWLYTSTHLVAAVETQGLDQKSDTFKTLKAEDDRLQQRKEAEILGDLEPAYREYERAKLVRWGVTAFALAALDTGEPISAAQLDRVTQILAANSERIQPNSDWAIIYTGWKTGDVKADT